MKMNPTRVGELDRVFPVIENIVIIFFILLTLISYYVAVFL
jgi:hypothetical protein